MMYSTILSALALLSVVSGAALEKRDGCYTGGLTWGDITDQASKLQDYREAACKDLAGRYPAGSTQKHCITVGENSIKFSAKNFGGRPLELTQNDCVAALAIEMNACSHGSYQKHGSFYYTDDPNSGAC